MATFGLSQGWDEDLYAGSALTSAGLTGAIKKDKALLGNTFSKASELLRRATEAEFAVFDKEDKHAAQIWPDVDKPALDQSVPDSNQDLKEKDASQATSLLSQQVGSCNRLAQEVQEWYLQAPKTLGLAGSFRAAFKQNKITLPFINEDGTTSVRLFCISPSQASTSSSLGHTTTSTGASVPAASADSLLQAQVDVCFGGNCGLGSETWHSLPNSFKPLADNATVLLEQYCKLAPGCFAENGAEVFELLSALFGPKATSTNSFRQVLLRLSTWLARVNTRTVQQYLSNRTKSLSGSGSSCQERFGSNTQFFQDIFHLLTANCVRAALLKLEEVWSTGLHFDRLASVLAACGGSCATGKERRQWLRQQLSEWRKDSVADLMGTDMWHIYSLLAGDLDEVVADALDWRTAFAMFLWYRKDGEAKELWTSKASPSNDLQAAIVAFEEAVSRSGKNCHFRPVPPSASASRDPTTKQPKLPSSKQGCNSRIVHQTSAANMDLQFNAIRAAAGLIDCCDVMNYDYSTYTSNPLDIELAWHFSVVLLALQGEERASSALRSAPFQRLTHQYCGSLYAQGLSSWALYVAHFVTDDRARSALVQRIQLIKLSSSTTSSPSLA